MKALESNWNAVCGPKDTGGLQFKESRLLKSPASKNLLDSTSSDTSGQILFKVQSSCIAWSGNFSWGWKDSSGKRNSQVQYVLGPNLPPLLEITDNDSDETRAARKKREEDELVCRGHILNALSDHLYDLFTSSKCPKEIWKALENKYNNEKQGAYKFLTLKYFEFTMNDSESVLDQVHQLQILVSKLKDLKVEDSSQRPSRPEKRDYKLSFPEVASFACHPYALAEQQIVLVLHEDLQCSEKLHFQMMPDHIYKIH
ncbi:hypothetical protein RJ639_016328 [Escallonia herrerae]|uniref:Uncharacterized protein n=1 Tax=Escallonia herrerae TaxID=1293975 RepID=A0AA88VET6_9ASTE|nr:hypothetical protein RJ639_016328 [Escallonia herrerae]